MILSDAALYLTCHTTIITRVDLPYVGIAAAARALDGRASSSVWICGKLHRVTACRQASDEFPRVASNDIVRLHRYALGRSPHGVEKGDVNRVHRNTTADAGRPLRRQPTQRPSPSSLVPPRPSGSGTTQCIWGSQEPRRGRGCRWTTADALRGCVSPQPSVSPRPCTNGGPQCSNLSSCSRLT